jgi:regulator of sigma E protease
MISIFFVIVGISILILVHEWGHFIAARFFNLLVEEFGIGFPPRLFSKKKGETLYSINAVPLGGFVKIYGESTIQGRSVTDPKRSFVHQPAWKRAIIVSAGVAMNFIFGWIVISAILFMGSPSLILVDLVASDSPASVAGLQQGDQITGFTNADEFVKHIASHKGQEISLNIKRGKEELVTSLTPRTNPPKGEGAVGVALRDAGVPKHGFVESIGKGFLSSVTIVGAVFVGLYQAIFAPQNILGPVGIFDVAVSTGDLGLIYLFQFLALISLNLVVLNILPIPALDGGRLLFIAIEKIRGKKFNLKTEIIANAVGFSFLIILIILITLKDVIGLF